jgi:CBS domain-containing protein
MTDPTDEIAAHGPINRVAWTRGEGCADIADRLAGGTAIRIEGDLGRSCIRERIDTLVSRKLTSFDLVPVVVPHDVDGDAVERITVAVGDGPHSPFAVAIAARLGVTMDVPVTAVSVDPPDAVDSIAAERLDMVADRFPTVATRMIEGDRAVALLDGLDDATLLVVGAPGGSWFQRQLFGPGHRLLVAAPAGTLAVRSAPVRCFHLVGEGHEGVVGSEMSVLDARRVARHAVVSVARDGELVGVVHRRDLELAQPDATLREIMEPPVSVGAADEATAIGQVSPFFEGGPIPVVDGSGRIVGMITEPDLH